MGIASSGLMAAKKSLETTGHNISNVNTEGYSRQRVEKEARSPQRTGGNVYGKGVDVKQVKRIHDNLLEKRLRNATSDGSYHEGRVETLEQLEQIFSEVNGRGMNQILNDFFNGFRELANQPENDTMREIVRERSKLVVQDFHRINDRIEGVRDVVDNRIERSVMDINSLTTQIADLNSQIITLELNDNAESGDLRDQRDLAVRSLAEHFELNSYEDEMGRFVVNVVGVGSLVTGSQQINLEARRSRDSEDIYEPGTVNIIFEGRESFVLNDRFASGKLKADVETRNKELLLLKDEVDSLAYNIAHSTNALHRKAYINKPMQYDQDGTVINDGTYKQVTGIDFFAAPEKVKHAAMMLDLGSLVKESSDYIAVAMNPNSPADNRVALAIAKLQHEKIGNKGSATFEEQYLKTVGNISISSAKTRVNSEHSKGILAQVKTMRERYSGVSLDEEAANMVKFQHQYHAAAKAIETSEKMFNSLLDILR